MAIILGSKLIQDLDENKSVGIGILLPITRGNTGYFAQSFTSIEQVKSNLKNLLLTNTGERMMHPNFGTRLREMLFSQNTSELEARIETEIESTIRYWLPFVNVQEMVVTQNKENIDRNQFLISLTFSLAGQQQYETIEFNIEQ